jgi:tRNA nucleotidyltransferase (CCA-adding enzyme)
MLGFSNSTASLPMSTESQLREKLRKIEALFAGAGTSGERLAAEAALERVRARLAELGRQDPSIEMQFSMPDQWSRHLFLALCRRYGMKPYRYYRQRRNTIMVRAPKRFLDQVLWPEFSELDQALQAYLHQVTLRVIREEVYADASEAQEVSEALPPN